MLALFFFCLFLLLGAFGHPDRIMNFGTKECLDYSYYPQECSDSEKSQEWTFMKTDEDGIVKIKNAKETNKCVYTTKAREKDEDKSGIFFYGCDLADSKFPTINSKFSLEYQIDPKLYKIKNQKFNDTCLGVFQVGAKGTAKIKIDPRSCSQQNEGCLRILWKSKP